MNDPVGVVHHRGRYHLFYQHHPHSTVWDVACAWGHATGKDLVRWRHLPAALEPGDGDDGCWSGSVVVQGGRPVIAYTSVQRAAPDVGRVRFADADDPQDPELRSWRKQPWPEMEPPGDLRVVHLRDPYVWAEADAWRMLLGAGLGDGTPALLAYSSPDLRSWRFDGVLADGASAAPVELDLGELWECPQLLEVDGGTVLVVSVWRDHVLTGVACAVGTEDRAAFRPLTWRPLVVGGSAYAATTFRDSEGRPCSMAWLRADPSRPTTAVDKAAAAAGWAGVLTAPVVLSAGPEGVRAVPHADVDRLRGDRLWSGPAASVVDLADGDGCLDLLLQPLAGAQDVVLGTVAGEDVSLRLDGDGVRLPGSTAAVPWRVPGPDRALRVLTDVGVLEVFTGGGGWGAARLPGLRVTSVRASGDLTAWRLLPLH